MPGLLHDATIFALASGAGRAAVAIIRVSGPQAGMVLRSMCSRQPEPRRATLLRIHVPHRQDEVLDRALVLWLPAPGSFTGEDCVEFQIHGGRAVVDEVLGAIGTLEGCRLAEPGEFTRRAFLNGRMDLTGVEALADLIDAETSAQRRQAMRHLDGPLGKRTERWRATVLQASALIEAEIDFSDEGDVAELTLETVCTLLRPVADEIAVLLADERDGQGIRLREGFTVVVAGPPNAGKSTLMNALAKRDVAIVSPIAGTTRDVIEAHLDLGGLPIVLVDTAGMRDSTDTIEQLGIERARERAAQADLVLWLEAAGQPEPISTPNLKAPTIRLRTQIDRVHEQHGGCEGRQSISAVTGQGMAALLDRIRTHASQALVGAETSAIARIRHRVALAAALAALTRVVEGCDAVAPLELIAEDLRAASSQLGRIAGRIDVEDILGEIFSRFCIGK